MKDKQVGMFKIEGGAVYGPKRYMEEQGNALVDRIVAGDSHVFNHAVSSGQDIETAILVTLQTDYAGWKGFNDFAEAHGIGRRSS